MSVSAILVGKSLELNLSFIHLCVKVKYFANVFYMQIYSINAYYVCYILLYIYVNSYILYGKSYMYTCWETLKH